MFKAFFTVVIVLGALSTFARQPERVAANCWEDSQKVSYSVSIIESYENGFSAEFQGKDDSVPALTLKVRKDVVGDRVLYFGDSFYLSISNREIPYTPHWQSAVLNAKYVLTNAKGDKLLGEIKDGGMFCTVND